MPASMFDKPKREPPTGERASPELHKIILERVQARTGWKPVKKAKVKRGKA